MKGLSYKYAGLNKTSPSDSSFQASLTQIDPRLAQQRFLSQMLLLAHREHSDCRKMDEPFDFNREANAEGQKTCSSCV